MGISQTTVSKFQKRFLSRGLAENLQRSGRKTIAGVRGDRLILRPVKLIRREPLAIIINLVNKS